MKYRSSEIGSVESIGGSSRLIAFLFAELDGILNGILAAAAPSTVNVDLRVLRGFNGALSRGALLSLFPHARRAAAPGRCG